MALWTTCRSSLRAFKLKPRDAKSHKQLKLIHKLLAREDVSRVINACDSGREGELIFAYVMDTAETGKGKLRSSRVDDAPRPKPVERLWISSMTKQAIREGFEKLRPADQLLPLEHAARSRSEADWVVGMNATRAATLRGACVGRRRRLARACADADAWADRGTRARDPSVRPRALRARPRNL